MPVRRLRSVGSRPATEPNKKIDADIVYIDTAPTGAFRGYGLSQMIFAVESTIDEPAPAGHRSTGDAPPQRDRPQRPDAARPRRNREDLIGDYWLDQCIDLVRSAHDRGRRRWADAVAACHQAALGDC